VSALKVVHKWLHNYLSISSQEVVHKPFVEYGFQSYSNIHYSWRRHRSRWKLYQ